MALHYCSNFVSAAMGRYVFGRSRMLGVGTQAGKGWYRPLLAPCGVWKGNNTISLVSPSSHVLTSRYRLGCVECPIEPIFHVSKSTIACPGSVKNQCSTIALKERGSCFSRKRKLHCRLELGISWDASYSSPRRCMPGRSGYIPVRILALWTHTRDMDG